MMKPKTDAKPESADAPLVQMFSGWFGLFLGLALVKFGNPVIMEKYFGYPKTGFEWIFDSWPQQMGYCFLGILAVLGVLIARFKLQVPKFLLLLPLIWLGWQVIAASQSSNAVLPWPTVLHFCGGIICFYLGIFALGTVKNLRWFWAGLLLAFAIVLFSGFQQHFGGLEQTRKYLMQYVYASGTPIPEAFQKKIMSDRIFATLFYPNTLAGVILLFLPVMLAFIWSLEQKFTSSARMLLISLLSMASLACLYWSGSKAGWLILLLTGLIAGCWLPLRRKTKVMLAMAILVLGLSGFFIKYFVFFKKGATSVVARFDYWEAALQTTAQHPLFGTGPGTFGKAYEKLKKPDSEMALLVHNDYLEQASDSGIIGFLTFGGFVAGAMFYTWRYARLDEDKVRLAVWLGLLAWSVQSFFEFGLYIPAMGWTSFALLGWLLSQCGDSNRQPPTTQLKSGSR